MSEHNDVLRTERDAFFVRMILATWRYVLWILAASDILSGVSILTGPPTSRSSAAFKLLTQIQLSNSVIAGLMILSGILLLFSRTIVVGHFVSAITNGWWSVIILYIALLLHQPTSLIVVPWTGALALIHLVAGGTRVAKWRFERALERSGGADD